MSFGSRKGGPRSPISTRRPSGYAFVHSRAGVLVVLLGLVGCSRVGTEPSFASGPRAPLEPRPDDPIAAALVQPVRPFEEVRGLWVVRSTMTSAREVREMVESADAAGFNTILVQIRGRADAFYDSRLEPRAESATDGLRFDPPGDAIPQPHARRCFEYSHTPSRAGSQQSRISKSGISERSRNSNDVPLLITMTEC